MYTKPDMTDPQDALAHLLSELLNDSAPIGWERYRSTASSLIGTFDLKVRRSSPSFDSMREAFDASEETADD